MAGRTKYTARALIVDDEQSICDLLLEKLRSEGYDCRACPDAEQALALLHHEGFDVILSDLRMPGITGVDLMRRVQEQWPHSAFLLVTGEQDVRVGIEAMKLGAADYVVKPFRLDAVLHSVTQALAKKRLEIELENYRQRLEQMVEERTKELEAALRRVETTYEETLQALGAAIDLRDAGTAGHSFRVTQYALAIGRAMGCTASQLREISHGASLHDIGKIGIPDGILLKEAALSDEERAVMKTHVIIGYHLVSRIAFLYPAAEIVRTHHENFDGTGYPERLRGEGIPMGARIFAVADALDAMTSDRPYRKSLPFSAAFAEIESQAGRQFDPAVVKTFLGLDSETWTSIRAAHLAAPGGQPRRVPANGSRLTSST